MRRQCAVGARWPSAEIGGPIERACLASPEYESSLSTWRFATGSRGPRSVREVGETGQAMRPVIEELRPLRPSPSTARHRAHGCALVPEVALDGHDERIV